MYRLVIVAGPNRGSSFALSEGENSIGRQVDNHIVLTSGRVSKRHCALLVGENEVFLRDEGSTNGTFVNGSLVRKQELRHGDKIGVGEFVMELIRLGAPAYPSIPSSASTGVSFQGSNAMQLSRSIPSPQAQQKGPHLSLVTSREAAEPTDLPGKLKFIFEEKIMPIFYGMLLKSEYRSILAILFSCFVVIAVFGSAMPMQDLAEKSVNREALIRARVLAREVADRALPAIASHAESQIDLSLLEGEDSVKVVAITNLNLQIIAPQARLNQLFAGGAEAHFAVTMAKQFREGREVGMGGLINDHTAVFIEPIKTTDPRQIKTKVTAMAIVAIDFSTNMLQDGGLSVAYGVGFVIAGLAALLIFFITLRLSFKPYEVLNDDLDQVLRGELPRVTHEFKIEETEALWTNLNAAIQRLPKGGEADFNSQNQETQVNWDMEIAPLRAICDAGMQGFIGFDQDFTIVGMNPQFEEISGIRMDVIGQNVQQAARDQAFASLISDLKDRILSSPSRSVVDEFEFSGVAYQVIGVGVGPINLGGFVSVFKRKE